jgi:hypothetical protein
MLSGARGGEVMRIPDSFKAAQKAAMQDKTITWHPAADSTDALGGKYKVPADESVGSYQVNVRVISDALAAQQYGLQLGRDIQITSSDALPIPVGDFVAWEGRKYRIVGILPRDSHVMLLGEAVL